MNIKEAKEAVKKAVEVYLEKDKDGEYIVPIVRQRPLFLVGAPGIGKTAIMEQVASELDVALVSYSMTHHTRQSAIGLPFLKEVTYNGKQYTKSEYTMSEIIASVYDVIEKTGKKEGILFLDEINCVSETLAPSMLQFLQYKIFGNQQVPEGWVVVTAGNPPQFNKSVKEFDVATSDRLKMLDIEASFAVWKEYAYNAGIHPAILAFLELNERWFYKITSTVDGKEYITARGWEDLSTELQAYERHNFPVDEALIMQYITNKECARKFAVYYDLFKKYRVDYSVNDIIEGNITADAINKAQAAQFDERLSIISMLMETLGASAKTIMAIDAALQNAVKRLRVIKKDSANATESVYEMLQCAANDFSDEIEKSKAANALSANKKAVLTNTVKAFKKYKDKLEEKDCLAMDNAKQFETVKATFKRDVATLKGKQTKTSNALEHAFEFISKAWGNNQEMTLFAAELTVNKALADFIARYGCDSYFENNKSMLIYDEDKKISSEIDTLIPDDLLAC